MSTSTQTRRLSSWTVVLAAGLMALAWSPVTLAGNAQRGLEISAVCQSCHGIDGNLSLQDDYPKLGGQHFDYLVHALKAYRSGDRNHAIMSGFAQGLSDQDIEDLAAWYSRQEGLVDLRID